MWAVVSSSFPQTVWCLLCKTSTFLAYFAASVPCVPAVEAFPRGPWTVVTFLHLLKVNDAYVWFIGQSLPPLAAPNDFRWYVSRLCTCREPCLNFRDLVAVNMPKRWCQLSP